MKVICIVNLKGGVAKTVSAINIAHILWSRHNKNVLLIDNDKQGNTSKFFKCHNYDRPSIADVLTSKDPRSIGEAAQNTPRHWQLPYFDIIPANMNLLRADREILLDVTRPQQTRLKKALGVVEELKGNIYDYVVIDCAPDLNMSVINALVASDHVLIPIKIDNFALDGVEQLLEQIEETKEFNPSLRVAGGFVTMYSRSNVNTQGIDLLKDRAGLPMFETVIRKTVKVDETTFTGVPLTEYAPKSTAARDYVALVDEYIEKFENVTDNVTNEVGGQ